MSGKRVKKKNLLLPGAVIVLLLLAAALFFLRPGENSPEIPEEPGTPAATEPSSAELNSLEEGEVELGKGLLLTDIGGYTGVYMEDGSDEVLARILMIIVKNTSEKTVQYARITLSGGETQAGFTLTTLPPGESAVLLEETRMTDEQLEKLSTAQLETAVFFPEEPGLNQDKLQLQALDGMLNVTNISGADIDEEIAIYYKNASSDLLYGGITYRVTISGGLKAGEVRQIIASHFSPAGSRIMFTTLG